LVFIEVTWFSTTYMWINVADF